MEIIGYIIGGLILVAIVGAMIGRNLGRPSPELLLEVEKVVADLMKIAVNKVKEEAQEGEVVALDLEAMQENEATVQDEIRFIFTAERKGEHLIYTVSSQLITLKPHKFQVQCMLLAMIVLNQQLKRAGIRESDVQVELDRSELGTDFIYMQLTETQHERIKASIA